MQTPEQRLTKEIMLYCSAKNWLCFHQNVGTIKTNDNRYVRTGLPKGWPDLLIITDKGQALFCETKIHPRKPTADQIKMIDILCKRGFLAFVAYSLEEFIEKTEKVA